MALNDVYVALSLKHGSENEVNFRSLNADYHSADFLLTPANNHQLATVCGQLDENLRLLENHLDIKIHARGHAFHLVGQQQAHVEAARDIIKDLYARAGSSQAITREDIHLSIEQSTASRVPQKKHSHEFKSFHGMVKPRSTTQAHYIDHIKQLDINFAVGPAGTGKTFLAVACAVDALNKQIVQRILLVRPVVEAGEHLGFLPGDMHQKVDPFLRPLYDALYEMLGFEQVTNYLEQQVIEVAPLAYMRGRTLNDAFIILDESQNTTVEQMKMFLTRIGFNSKVVVTGDITQVDLPANKKSGLRHALSALKNIKGIHITYFHPHDVVRHRLVTEIVKAYEAHVDTENSAHAKS